MSKTSTFMHYGARNRLRQLVRPCKAGALTSDGLRRYEFDAANRLAAMTVGAVDTSPTTAQRCPPFVQCGWFVRHLQINL
jgi:hypothetical protein